MCGIAGALTSDHNSGLFRLGDSLSRMVAHMRHRGPDDIGSAAFTGEGVHVAMGSTRLAIIDLSPAGHQPMQDAITGNCIVYNGEIYNFNELREQLGGNKLSWQSTTDTEVILRAYAALGIDSLPRLRGMFALGIWDRQANKLILARDRFGIKPLYYYTTPASLVFASEVRALLESGLVPRKLSAAGTGSYLRFGAIQAPLSIIEGVRSLMPGHYLSIEPTQAGWQVCDAAYAKDMPEAAPGGGVPDRAQAAKRLRSILEDSIKAHLVSDVPVAAFLSGGIDSSTVVGLMSRVSGEPPRTFTVVFEEKEFSEESYARQVAERFGAKHHDVVLSETSLLQMLPQALAAMDQPTIDGINTYVISKAVAETGIKVALSGLGSDELFGGYPTFRRARQLRNLALVPEPVRRTAARTGQTLLGRSVKLRKAWSLLAQGGTPLATYTVSRQLFSREEVAALTNRDLGIDSMEAASPFSKLAGELNAMSDYEMRGYMANMLLRDTDHMSMAHSLEVRVPFLDSQVVSFVLGLPDEWKLDGGRPKPLLLDAIGDLLPEAVWRRPKMGFTLPFERWMHSALHQDLAGTFNNNGGLSHLGITDFASNVWKTFDRTPRLERWGRPWSLHILKTWCEINGVTL